MCLEYCKVLDHHHQIAISIAIYMEGHQHQHHQQQQQHQHQHHQYGVHLLQDTIGPGAASGDRFPQWSIQETRDFLMIRAELDPTFMETKRNKLLWEVIATKMREKGYNRSADQCKCKWKNLVTRYKVRPLFILLYILNHHPSSS